MTLTTISIIVATCIYVAYNAIALSIGLSRWHSEQLLHRQSYTAYKDQMDKGMNRNEFIQCWTCIHLLYDMFLGYVCPETGRSFAGRYDTVKPTDCELWRRG